MPVVVADWAAVGEGARRKKLVEEMAYHQVVGDGEAEIEKNLPACS